MIGDWNGDGWNDIAVTCQNYAGQSSYLAVHDQLPPAITAAATPFGSGCGTPALVFVADTNGRPLLGQTGSATVTNVPSALVSVMLGFSNTSRGGMPLPFALDVIGMPGCALLQSAEILGLPTSPGSANQRAFSLAIPASTAFLGATLFLQAHAHAPGQNALDLITSNGLTWLLGNQ